MQEIKQILAFDDPVVDKQREYYHREAQRRRQAGNCKVDEASKITELKSRIIKALQEILPEKYKNVPYKITLEYPITQNTFTVEFKIKDEMGTEYIESFQLRYAGRKKIKE